MTESIKSDIKIGTQGWNYEGWVGPFYPRGTGTREMLSLYSKIFNTVEIDSTFYAIPAESSVRGWAERTPKEFTFSVKLPSEITHKNRLKESGDILNRFVDRMALLGNKLGCVLIQLPPDFSPVERKSLSAFIKSLPAGFKFAVEFRDDKWINEEVLAELKQENVALAMVDSRWVDRKDSLRLIDTPTAPFAYIRWLGPRELTDYSRIQIDRTKELKLWADAVTTLKERVSTIYGYFNNHFQGHSPASSNLFKELIGLQTVSPESLISQPSLF